MQHFEQHLCESSSELAHSPCDRMGAPILPHVPMRWCRMVLACSLILCYVLLPPASPLIPNDPNVCSSWESYSVSRTEKYMVPHHEETQEDCDDPRSNYRCTRHKITYRQTYRLGVQTDYRKRSHCCQGYYESRGVCVAQCSQECVHGRCVGPDRCQCEPGWRGSDCSSSECGDGCWNCG
ncbi:multiple epidermal growth factor-like domains protein 11 isoform X1 [Hypanus sabinus]|uniref:multiple epidermal growth factor-like domains protein 11 isoform X1 n=2 Tax=Hypanus sabinus TaxID=79690 RepID=UPI0028C41644|nr:multiple epidermal growth factor-like domains protein 11 isoform X1 [Hypanus sabinus]XP_059835939.1 multiple epidermal growth factor-like domains protein 11 isoform X1 [Hypanus sabinus]XP_059835940.1 multiple epidermal growth factor-like domains protein 11 isoform X1 [Hypanus sabinus]